jgi:hypothetical protein
MAPIYRTGRVKDWIGRLKNKHTDFANVLVLR